ncbi:hypothetical protein D7Y11_11375 [Corallococcus sp. AB018]|uniref:hypothetical protein n=1 Tax=Corallococcus sp. AB018 TaxID=2316715 RepID=UPI000F860248|nr:hypothetical protein [Corallococcus sp. AB018]RUO93081.1 hypothetical protein D7Y11_11375 [Corallococcus sp. AB018]
MAPSPAATPPAQVRESSKEAPLASAVLDLLEEYPVVGLGEEHRGRQFHDFFLELVAHPRFAEQVDDVVIEYGGGPHQGLADRYFLELEAIPDAELSRIWRDTTQWLVWDSPLYERDLKAIRRLNETLPRAERVRVVLGDPPIPWSEVRNARDYKAYEDRDGFFAETTRHEVLAKGRRGLLVAGSAHFMEKGPRDPAFPKMEPNTAEHLNGTQPGTLFTVLVLPAREAVQKELGLGEASSLIVLGQTDLGARSYAVIMPRAVSIQVVENGEKVMKPLWRMSWPPMRDVVDGLLWLGMGRDRVDPPAELYLEPAYQHELRRRAAILSEVNGGDYAQDLQSLIDEARAAKSQEAPLPEG